MTPPTKTSGIQRGRRPWRRYIDGVEGHRAALHAHCLRLTGNVWDAEDLAQDTLMRVFSTVARSDTPVADLQAYLLRTATNQWIDAVRKHNRVQATTALEPDTLPAAPNDNHPPTHERRPVESLFERLHPQERATIVMKEVLTMPLADIAATLGTTEGAVKSALSRARGRLEERRPAAAFAAPPKEIVDQFMRALIAKDLETLKSLCAQNVAVELVGGAEMHTFEASRKVFQYAHMVMPRLGFGAKPWWELAEYEGEPVVLGFRTLDGVEGLNEVHRIETANGLVTRIRIYCFCSETLRVVAQSLGRQSLPRPRRSPGLLDVVKALLGVRPSWRSTLKP